tara:strand:+ start:5221 stop:5403 length:183 start_codon:yes stop_codon:yes gene_type:complete
MKTRVFSNWVTTILGVVILLFSLYMIYAEKQTAQELSGWMAVGLLFLRSKDSLIALPPKE